MGLTTLGKYRRGYVLLETMLALNISLGLLWSTNQLIMINQRCTKKMDQNLKQAKFDAQQAHLDWRTSLNGER